MHSPQRKGGKWGGLGLPAQLDRYGNPSDPPKSEESAKVAKRGDRKTDWAGMLCQPTILFGVERLMKNKLKTRLFTALTLSGGSFCWLALATTAQAQEDDYGFIRLAEPIRQHDFESSVAPPAVMVSPPMVKSPTTQVPVVRSPAAAAAAMPFTPANGFSGNSTDASASYAQHQSSDLSASQAAAQQVSHDELLGTGQPPIIPGIYAKRGLPPITTSTEAVAAQVNQPFEQNDLPPTLLPVQTAAESGLPPIVTSNPGLSRLLNKSQMSGAEVGANQNEFSFVAAQSSLNTGSEVTSAGFGSSPVLIQDTPPIVSGTGDLVVPGSLSPSASNQKPMDTTTDLPSLEDLPQGPPLGSVNAPPRSVPRAVFESTAPVDTATIPRETYFEPVTQAAPVYGGCSTCGTSSGTCDCGASHGGLGISSCSSCGEGGCFDQAAVEELFNSSGANAYARRYLIAEALYFNRTDGTISNSNFGSLNDFDGNGGARITVGRRTDSTRGREIQYSGIAAVEDNRLVNSAGGLAQSNFVPFGGLTGDNLQSFFNATEQNQSAETYFHSLEFNRVKWGWDVIKSYIGLRYLYVDDEYTLFSQSRGLALGEQGGPVVGPTDPQSGFFQTAAVNHLIGPIIGGELFYDVGYRWSLSGVSRAGAYLNINQFDTNLTNDGVQFIDAEDDSVTVAFSYEFGINAKYRLTRQSQFRFGYNILFLDNLSTVSSNLTNQGGIGISPTFGTSTSDSGDIFFHGLSVGFEFYR